MSATFNNPDLNERAKRIVEYQFENKYLQERTPQSLTSIPDAATAQNDNKQTNEQQPEQPAPQKSSMHP